MEHSQELVRTAVRDIMSLNEDGTIKDIMDLMDKGTEFGNKFLKRNHSTGSIIKKSSDLVLVFPVLVSNTLKMQTALLISKAIERKCVALLNILFSSTNMYNNKDVGNIYDYIGQYHTNIDGYNNAITLDDFITAMRNAVGESSIINKDDYDMVMEWMEDINSSAKDALRESSINDYKIRKTPYNVNVTLEADQPERFIKDRYGNEIPAHADFVPAIDRNNEFIDSEVKKANELQPTMMTVNFLSNTGNNVVKMSGVIGVKAKMYPVDHTEIVGRLSSKYSDSNTLFSLIRCSTKEKSFFKDFAFALEKTKFDAINIAKGSVNSRLFRLLERRAARNRLRLLKIGDGSPITTLVISQEEVEYLKKYSNMDIEKANVAKVILDGYNLMGIVIVDDSLEIAKFLNDGDTLYETLTYDALKKESKNDDINKIVNLMSKMSR